MSSEGTPPAENAHDVNPSARLLSELAEMSRSHFLISRRQQVSTPLARINPSLDQSPQESRISSGKALISGGVDPSHPSQQPLRNSNPYWNSQNSTISTDMLLSYPNQKLARPQYRQNRPDDQLPDRYPDRHPDRHSHTPAIHTPSTGSPLESPGSSGQGVGSTRSPQVRSTNGSPSVLSPASPSHKQEKAGEGGAGADPGAGANPQHPPLMEPPPALPNIGQTEIDRLMLLVQAQGRSSGSPTEGGAREAPYSLPSGNGYGSIHPNASASQSSPDAQSGSQSDSPSDNSVHSDGPSPANSSSASASLAPGHPRGAVAASVHTSPTSGSHASSRSGSRSGSHSHSDYNFPCTYQGCTKRFKQRAHLHTHLRSHTGERPYVCPFQGCRKWFSQRCNLRTHIRSHTGERPYQCEICGKAFSQQGNMRHHLLIHYNEHPLVCKIENCNKKFNQLGNLKAHQNAAHRSTVHAFTMKLQSGQKLEDLPEEEREMFEYFCELYKNSNRGIRGRGKGTKTIVYRGASREPTDRFIPEFILREHTYEPQQKQPEQPEQSEQPLGRPQPAQTRLEPYSHGHLPSNELQQLPQMPSQAYNTYSLGHQQLLSQQMGQQVNPQVSQQVSQMGHLNQIGQQMGQHMNQQTPPMGQQMGQTGPQTVQMDQGPAHQPNQQMGQRPSHMSQQVYPDRYQDMSTDVLHAQPQQYSYSYHMPMQQIQQPVPYPLYTYQQLSLPISDTQTDPATGVPMYPPKDD